LILNLRFYIPHLLIYTSLIYILNLPILKISLNTTFFDLMTNTYLNDFGLNNFYFIWTQFYILPLMLIGIFIYYNVLNLKWSNILYVHMVLYFTILLAWGIVEYYILNQYLFTVKHIPYYFNNLLSNPLNKYHPILFFTCYIFIYTTLKYRHSFNVDRSYSESLNKFITYTVSLGKSINYYWFLILISLYLGSWWALQEGSWGGWWNWDASEVFGLVILTFLLLILHTHPVNYSWYINFDRSTLYVHSVIIMYVILQLSYGITSHNFGLSLLGYGFVKLTLTLILALVINLLLIVYKIRKYFIYQISILLKILRYNNLSSPLNMQTLYKILFVVLILCIYAVSFNPLVNNIFWNVFHIEFINNINTGLNINLIIMLLLFLGSTKFNLITLTTYLLLNITCLMHLYLIICLLFQNISYVKSSHNLLLLVLWLPLLLTPMLVVHWNFLVTAGINWSSLYVRGFLRNNITTDNTYVWDTIPQLNLFNLHTTSSFFWLQTNIDSQFFLLTLSDYSLLQSIYNHSYLYVFNVEIYESSSNLVDICTFILIIHWFYLNFLKLKIVF
jgi:hypothetical protein